MTTYTRPASGRIGTLLGIWAHPDDEAYLSAAFMAQARRAGERVVVATATKGELGTDDPMTWPPARLARVREREALASLAALDVREHHWLGHRDGTLHQVDRGVDQVIELIEDVRPDTIVTFGPDGMTGHLDHRTVSRWVSTAWESTGRQARLWHATLTPEFHRRWGPLNSEVGLWFEGSQPPSTPESELAYAVHCDQTMIDQKFVALRAHGSQTSGLITAVGEQRYRDWWASEYFANAAA